VSEDDSRQFMDSTAQSALVWGVVFILSAGVSVAAETSLGAIDIVLPWHPDSMTAPAVGFVVGVVGVAAGAAYRYGAAWSVRATELFYWALGLMAFSCIGWLLFRFARWLFAVAAFTSWHIAALAGAVVACLAVSLMARGYLDKMRRLRSPNVRMLVSRTGRAGSIS
jgi:hypothetical protein